MVGEQCGRDEERLALQVVEEGLVLHVPERHESKAARWTQADLQGMQHELNAERWTQDP